VSTYVLDLLSETDARQALSEAHRVLIPSGRLCLVSLTYGVTFPSRIVSALWQQLFRLRATIVGGCRPIRLAPLLDHRGWLLMHRNVMTPFGVPSEVLVACPIDTPNGASERFWPRE
jgi:hypothetical protein